jgi:hypothetical protein
MVIREGVAEFALPAVGPAPPTSAALPVHAGIMGGWSLLKIG